MAVDLGSQSKFVVTSQVFKNSTYFILIDKSMGMLTVYVVIFID